MDQRHEVDGAQCLERLRRWSEALGFSQIGVAGIELPEAERGLAEWLAAGFHGSMDYMARHGPMRARPAELVPGTVSVVTVWADYLPRDFPADPSVEPSLRSGVPNASPDRPREGEDWRDREWRRLADPHAATISLYARGRDYHKVMRGRLRQLADRLAAEVGPFGHRVFADSAPVMEAALAARSGLGWRGKHTLLLSRTHGSMGFVGELFVDFALPFTEPVEPHCGSCGACIEVCPTRAIVAPGRLDARRCISYLTIEHDGPIPLELRPLIGNRIVGCDDCQLVCPWNKFARRATIPDFDAREPLGDAGLLELWAWSEAEFLRRTEGSVIRRIGWRRWRRNLAVALGNARRQRPAPNIDAALHAARCGSGIEASDALVEEHVAWALESPRPRTGASVLIAENSSRSTAEERDDIPVAAGGQKLQG